MTSDSELVAPIPALAEARAAMVSRQIEGRNLHDPRVLAALREVPRECFVGPAEIDRAYEDRALPIACGQTISQPYIVALMAEAAEIRPGDRVLEIGAGSGYATAVLSRIAGRVYAIERHHALTELARRRIALLGYRNVALRTGDGRDGWPEAAPFDVVLVSARGDDVPPALLRQLMPGGRLIMPVGSEDGQRLLKITRTRERGDVTEDLGPVRFVPLVPGDVPGDLA